MENNSAGEIPEEVLFEILIRLPVKSLYRFRSVCTLWLSIISDPYFLRSHRSHSKTRSKLLLMGYMAGSWKKWFIYGADHPEQVRAGEFPSSWLPNSWYYNPRPSVHGLICFPLEGDRGHNIGILNPSTGENITISHPQVSSTGGRWYQYSFGFDPVSEKHKVVYTYETPEKYHRELWVYTLGSVEKWRRVVGVLDRHQRKLAGSEEVCIDGVIYFRVMERDGYHLASFDLKSESFQMVRLSFPRKKRMESYVLIEFNGSVAIVDRHFYYTDPRINVWVLEDFHKQVWELKRSVSLPDSWWETLSSRNWLKLGCTLRGGELLVFTPFRQYGCGSRSLFFWNTVSNNFRRSRIDHVPACNLFYSEYVENLLPLKAP